MEQGIDFDTATDLVSRTCAYTNHTILAEALEKWPLDYLNEVVPQLVPIIEKLDAKQKKNIKMSLLRSLIRKTVCIWLTWTFTMALV